MTVRIVAIANQKGGSGKTTTAVAFAYSLARSGNRVLLVDLDPQAHATTLSGVLPPRFVADNHDCMTAVLADKMPITNVIVGTAYGYDLALSDETLLTVETGGAFARSPHWSTRLRAALKDVPGYDFVIIDCAPHMGLVTQCGIIAAHQVFIPVEAHPLALLGLYQFMDTINSLKSDDINPNLTIAGVMLCKYSDNERVCQQVRKHLEGGPLADDLWGDRISRCTAVPRSAAVTMEPGHGVYENVSIPIGQPVQAYSPNCTASKEYNFAAERLMEMKCLPT